MKCVNCVQSVKKRHIGLVCMSTDTRHLLEFKRLTDGLKSVSQAIRKEEYEKKRRHIIGD